MNHVDPAKGAIVVVLEPFEDALFMEPVVATAGIVASITITGSIVGRYSHLFQSCHRVADTVGLQANATAFSFVVYVAGFAARAVGIIE